MELYQESGEEQRVSNTVQRIVVRTGALVCPSCTVSRTMTSKMPLRIVGEADVDTATSER